jgi:hypothetical protein
VGAGPAAVAARGRWREVHPLSTRPVVRRSRTCLLAIAACAAGALAGAPALPAAHALGPRVVLDVRDFGATGDGITDDAPAVDRAIAAAAAAGRGTVALPPGTYLAGSSIHMLSGVTLRLDAGSTILGSAARGYDPPEANPNSAFQDFGHSHFHDAMIWGDRLTDVGFVGSGTIDGGGHLTTGDPASGQADKIISLTRCDGLRVDGITLRRGGHFAMLINGCSHVSSDHLTISTAGDRDGWNVVSARNVRITNLDVASNDDALAFKSDWALGATLRNGNVTVTNAHLSARCCNALMFGSETCGDFTHYRFSHITITHAGKSGLGMVSMDGARITDVRYSDVTMSGTASPIMEKIGTRRRCGGSPAVGGIGDVRYHEVTGTGAGAFSPTLWGQPGHRIHDVTFDGVDLTLPGGHGAVPADVPGDDSRDYNPGSIGTRPAYGLYLHEIDRVRFVDSSLRSEAGDARPAVIASSGGAVTFTDATARRGTAPFDVGFQGIAGYCVADSADTAGGALRRSATAGSTRSCDS